MAGNLSPPILRVETQLSPNGQRQDDSITPVAPLSAQSNVSNPFLTPFPSNNPFLTPTGGRSRASSVTVPSPDDALRPTPGTEADFQVDNNPFAYSPGQLNKLLNPKSLPAFQALGGLRGVAHGLQTDVDSGLSVDETGAPRGRIAFQEAVQYGQFGEKNNKEASAAAGTSGHADDHLYSDRIRVYGRNVLPAKKGTSLWRLMWNSYNDKVLILLTAAAAISLGLGLYETFGAQHEPGAPPPVDWIEGLAICIAIIIVVAVGSINDWQKERAFVKLNQRKDDREVKVVRSGKAIVINVYDVLVGDVMHLEPGDLVPVDGIFISGHDLRCDESSATGESDAIRKTPAEIVSATLNTGKDLSDKEYHGLDPFIISGSKVLEGVGTFLTTSVGENSSFGKIMMSVRTEMESTPLQKKLEGLAGAIAKLGSSAAALLFFVLLFRFVAGLAGNTESSAQKASDFTDILIVAITVIVVAVPEGLPLAVTLALAFATTSMLKENNLVRVLRACETMGNATTICSDKTGTLTTNRMTVVAGRFGSKQFDKPNANATSSSTRAAQFARDLALHTKDIIVQSVAINSTAFEGEENGQATFIGSKTETALLQFAKDHFGMGPLSEVRHNEQTVQLFPFDSSKKCMGAVIRLPNDQGYRLLVKGASEILLGYCTSKADADTLENSGMTESDRTSFAETIDTFARQSLRTIGLVYRDFTAWPPAEAEISKGQVEFASLLRDLAFLGVVGIQDPVRPGVPEAVRKAQHAGVVVRMVTGDNATTAQVIATECGIYTEGGLIMEGPVFRELSDDNMVEIIPRLQVLARSSPEDKRVLVAKLKSMGETVAVTGDGTNDAPALKTADVGFSMGISGTEVAKEASAIVLMDDNFASILTALKWGRAVNDSVQKFLQFQITVNITAVLLTFISAVANPDMHPVLTAVQLLWVNLIMDTFAALALATDPPTDRVLDRKPQPKSAPLITTNMWKMIIGQAIFQLTVTLILHFAGARILGYDENDSVKKLELATMVFNTFVWMQIFNEFNNRRLDNGFNIFEGVHRNKFFIVINCIMVGAQVAIVFVGDRAFSIKVIDGPQWAICVVLALFSLPWAVAVRLFPDPWFAAIAKVVGTPVAVAYRALGRVFGRFGKLFKKNKARSEDEKVEESRGESVAAPDILITGYITPNGEDVEKGRV